YVIPVRYAQAPLQRVQAATPGSLLGAMVRAFLVVALAMSVGLNILLLLASLLSFDSLGLSSAAHTSIIESFHSGQRTAETKVAILHMDGVIMEGSNQFIRDQLDQAAEDPKVKAVVLRINSPGGTITGSDDLHRRIVQLRDGKHPQQKGGPKPVIASMGAVAASGGYYIAMPTDYVFAEPTTITGSIGVYAAFPNVSKLADKWGVSMNVIKAGDIKDSGSMFHDMSPQERQLWQEMVDNAYQRFIEVCETGRPELKGKFTEVVVEKDIPDRDETGKAKLGKSGQELVVKYIRRRADGGIWMADEAQKLGLVDKIGYLEAAIAKAKEKAQLGDCRVVQYEKPSLGLFSLLGGVQAPTPGGQISASQLSAGATPRLWYLAPGAEMSGLLSALGRE
ncbi:MAG: signal peptide peptidase SppA, partial [Planctomycetia bacterium]|nr:signal peptide peptidase SppA [Planctomycetia bacterium]